MEFLPDPDMNGSDMPLPVPMDTIAETVREALIQAAREAYAPDTAVVATCPTCGYGFRAGEAVECGEECA